MLTAAMFRQLEEKNTLTENIYVRLLRHLKALSESKEKILNAWSPKQLSLPSIL